MRQNEIIVEKRRTAAVAYPSAGGTNMIQRNGKINAMRRMLAAGLALLAVVPAALAGPFVGTGREGRNADAIRHHL